MVSINSSMGHQKLTFGAQDIATSSQVINPPQISNDPYGERYSFVNKDLYGLNGSNADLAARKLSSPNLEEYDKYIGSHGEKEHDKEHKKGIKSLIKPLLVLGGITAATVLVVKKGKAIAGLFKKNDAQVVSDKPKFKIPFFKSAKNVPTTVVSVEKFNQYFNGALSKAETGNLEKIVPENFKVILRNKDAKSKAETLDKLYQVAEIYNQKELQSRVTLIMPEDLDGQANHILDMFKANRIDEVDPKLVKRIEGFKLIHLDRRGLADKSDMVVDKQVRHGVNANSPEDLITKWGRNFKELFKGIL